ncbi:MAG TPA: ATP-binding protein [Mucilaginibacter sp.]|jgi:signal transduction histidine kinase
MKIKNRLSLYFTCLGVLVLLIVQIVICITFNSLVKTDFYGRLLDRANVAAKLYLGADQISPDSLNRVREQYLKRLPDEVIRLYDDKNAASFIKDKNQFWSAEVIDAVRKRGRMGFPEGDRRTVGVYYKSDGGNFVILVSAIDFQGDKRLKDLIVSMAILLAGVTVALFVISRWFAQKALQPIDQVIDQMRLVSTGNLSLRVNEGNGKDEISILAHSFNQLLQHLENAFELQKTFVTDASHELRTPITTIIGEIEIALNKVRANAEYEQILQSILAEAGRLNETVVSLLEMANVDVNYTQSAFNPVAIDELIWELNDYWAIKAGKGLVNISILHLPDDYEKLQLLANKSLLTVALNNIIGNALKFSGNKPVQCTLHVDETCITIKIIDSGIGIMPDEIKKIFGSFYRGTNVKGYQGSGVGLYVTNKIISLFNGKITVDSMPGKGTTMTIRFQGKF